MIGKIEKLYRSASCNACGGPMERSKHLNLVSTPGKKAPWKYPTGGNVLNGKYGEPVSVVCDECIDAKNPIEKCIELVDGGLKHHRLEDIPDVN